MARNSNSKRSKNTISNVRVVSDDEGTEGVKVEKMLNAVKESKSQVRLVCGFQFSIAIAASAATGTSSFPSILASDEFVDLAKQFNTARVRAIRYDVYDLNPNASITNFFSTYHQVNSTGVPQTLESVVDRPDSKSVAPGTGRQTFYWVANGPAEMEFQSNTGPDDFGGLSYSIGGGSAVSGKYQVIVKAIVDFRGRS
jgi:hypothetical protein